MVLLLVVKCVQQVRHAATHAFQRQAPVQNHQAVRVMGKQ